MSEFDDAKALLGFGSDNWLRLDYDEDVEDEVVDEDVCCGWENGHVPMGNFVHARPYRHGM